MVLRNVLAVNLGVNHKIVGSSLFFNEEMDRNRQRTMKDVALPGWRLTDTCLVTVLTLFYYRIDWILWYDCLITGMGHLFWTAIPCTQFLTNVETWTDKQNDRLRECLPKKNTIVDFGTLPKVYTRRCGTRSDVFLLVEGRTA